MDRSYSNLPPYHRFFEMSCRLGAYQGVDILSVVENNELFTGLLQKQAIARHAALLRTKPMPDACVLVVLTDETLPRLLLTRRASHLSTHAGEVAFVGGKRDESDISSLAVALREAYEEVGLLPKSSELIGYLPMQISKKGLLVRPVVVSVAPSVADELTPSQDEIERIFWLPLDHIKNNPPVAHTIENYLPKSPKKLQTPAWHFNQDGEHEIIWGLTGRILASLLHIAFHIHHCWYYKIK